jgi:glyoxylase-like metal-dependent hydrolase (beta-lactamase superfamily II)
MTRVLEGVTLGAWQANCYVVGDRDAGRAVVVDPGQDGVEPVEAALARLDLELEAVLLTHGHLDHLWSAPELAARHDVAVYLHDDDRFLWEQPGHPFGADAEMLRAQFGLEWVPDDERLRPLAEGEELALAGSRFAVRHTPGHTPGSCVFLLDGEQPVLLAGDLIFAGSVGRTDFPRGDQHALFSSISRVVLALPDRTVIQAGHGPATTVGVERRSNPFLQASGRGVAGRGL